MTIIEEQKPCQGIKFSIKESETEVARARLIVFHNDLHKEPLAYLEDVYVHADYRRQGYGRKIVDAVIAKAKLLGCYKITASSRHGKAFVHKMYEKFGFTNHGVTFRMDLTKE